MTVKSLGRAPLARRTLLLAALLIVGITTNAHALKPLVPGQVKSEALAESYWHTGCAHVGVSPLTVSFTLVPDTDRELGYSLGACRIQISPGGISREAAETIHNQLTGYVNMGALAKRKMRPRLVRRQREVLACAVIVHEYGHLAGYYDPIGYTNPITGIVDHSHSPDPRSIMYPGIGNGNTPPACLKLFPR